MSCGRGDQHVKASILSWLDGDDRPVHFEGSSSASQAEPMTAYSTNESWFESSEIRTPDPTAARAQQRDQSSFRKSQPFIPESHHKAQTVTNRVTEDQAAPVSILTEARQMRLCHDYRTRPYLLPDCVPPCSETFSDDLDDPAGATDVGLLAALSILNDDGICDKWEVDRDTAAFLAAIIAEGKANGSCTPLQDLCRDRRHLKIEEPLLPCDHTLELRQVKSRNVVELDVRHLEPFAVSDEEDEGLPWPTQLQSLPSQMDKEISLERLDVDQQTLEYIRAVTQLPMLNENVMTTESNHVEKVLSATFGIGGADQT